jgi:hypothetical protein
MLLEVEKVLIYRIEMYAYIVKLCIPNMDFGFRNETSCLVLKI